MASFNELPALGWSDMPRRLLNILAILLLARFGLFLYSGWRVRMRFRKLQDEGIVRASTHHSSNYQRMIGLTCGR